MNNETICAISTAPGQGAIAIIRVSGKDSIIICEKLFLSKNGESLSNTKNQQVILGNINHKSNTIDEVLITLFNAPRSYTGENMVEIACHGSTYIQSKIIQILIENGCRLAKKGEFTLRAFLNGKLDLSQAEGVANLISSENARSHDLAMKQMRGGFSNEIKILRDKFIKFASLIELELDFSQEDVEFANRKDLISLVKKIKSKISVLTESFKLGNAIKHGIPITIIGHPNSGKSTLLNQILNEDRAIVSDVMGTTRDVIEESITLNGYKFRFIDTAGLRKTSDKIEKIGISKTHQKIVESAFVLYMIDKTNFHQNKIENEIINIQNKLSSNQSLIIAANKSDINTEKITFNKLKNCDIIDISAKNGDGVKTLLNTILSQITKWEELTNSIIVINHRHFESLKKTMNSIQDVEKGLKLNLSGELLSIDIKNCLNNLGEITGEITNDNLLDSIFKDFCIGK